MINLLPSQEKKELIKEEKYKLVLILGVLILLFLISLSLVLLAIKINISGAVKIQETFTGSEEVKFGAAEAEDVEKEIKLINQTLLSLNAFYKNQPNFTELTKRISQALPEGVYLTHLSLAFPSVSLQGFSPTRDTLYKLKQRLEAESGFNEVYFPPSNWVKSKDIDFSVTFKFSL